MGKNWAISVGINVYDNLLPLKYAQRDAEAMAAWFKDEANFEQVFLFTKDSPPIRQANPPIPTQPTFARFQRFLDVQFERPLLKPEDNLWFFFAGHGRRYADQDYLMFLDSNPFILLEQSATLKDVEPLKYQASLAENEGNLPLAEQMWIRIWAVSRGDLDAIAAIQRIAVKKITERQYLTQKPVISTQESTTLPRGEGREASETEIQREKEHQQNLGQYRQSFFQAVEQEFPLNEPSRRQLRNLQQSLQLTDEEISQIEQPIFDQKEAERLRQQQEADRLEQQKAERIRQQQGTIIAPPTPITRKQFLKWAGLGGACLVTAVVAREIFKQQPLKQQPPSSKQQPPSSKQQKPFPTTANITLEPFDFEVKTVDAQGKVTEQQKSQAKFFKEDLGNSVTLEMVAIPGEKFLMGTEDEEIERLVQKFDWEYFRREKPQHEVTVRSFFMSKYHILKCKYWVVNQPNHFYLRDNRLQLPKKSIFLFARC